jgi:hypothetical protein
MAQRRTQRKAPRTGKTASARWNSGRERPRRRPGARRKKISTTVAAESYGFLQRLIKDGKANTLAEAVDSVLDEARRIDNRERLDRMTAEAYENMSSEEMAENKELEQALTQSIGEMHLDE